MPLPPAPTRRAALLSPEAYEAPVRRTGTQATAEALPVAPETAAQATPARAPARKAATGTSQGAQHCRHCAPHPRRPGKSPRAGA